MVVFADRIHNSLGPPANATNEKQIRKDVRCNIFARYDNNSEKIPLKLAFVCNHARSLPIQDKTERFRRLIRSKSWSSNPRSSSHSSLFVPRGDSKTMGRAFADCILSRAFPMIPIPQKMVCSHTWDTCIKSTWQHASYRIFKRAAETTVQKISMRPSLCQTETNLVHYSWGRLYVSDDNTTKKIMPRQRPRETGRTFANYLWLKPS